MTLRETQSKFAGMVARLILHAEILGYEVTFGDTYRSPEVTHGHDKSLHCKRLAVDLNLFKNGRYLRSTKSHEPLGEYWESIGGSWGGRFEDGNHYSIAWRGMK